MPKYENKERDEALIAIDEAFDMLGGISDASEARDKLLVAMRALRGDEPAKPDRYVVAFKDAKDAYIGPNRTEHESDQAAAAVLRRHFEPSAEVVEAARFYDAPGSRAGNILARFVLSLQNGAPITGQPLALITDEQIKQITNRFLGWRQQDYSEIKKEFDRA